MCGEKARVVNVPASVGGLVNSKCVGTRTHIAFLPFATQYSRRFFNWFFF